jgi:hypothetical protein
LGGPVTSPVIAARMAVMRSWAGSSIIPPRPLCGPENAFYAARRSSGLGRRARIGT